MRQPGPSRDSDAFLSALADELSSGPDQAIANRHVIAAVAAARSARQLRRSQVIRTVAAALAVATVFGTGGIAAAGGLPAPIQAVVADMARALPVPFDLPYPKVVVGQTAFGDPAEVTRRPEDAEIGLDSLAPAEVEVSPPDESAAPAPAPPDDDDGQEDSTRKTEVDHPGEPEHRRCDLGADWNDRDDLDRSEVEELRAESSRCLLELRDPPRFARGLDRDSEREDRGADRDERSDRDRDDQGSDDQGRHDQGRDFDSSDSEHSDETRDRTDDEEEERHDRQDESGHRFRPTTSG